MSQPAALLPTAPAPGPNVRHGLATKLIRSLLPLMLLGAVLASTVRRAAQPLANPDTYFHLRFGHEFLTSWSLSHPGSVSTFATADWLPTQWLPQVLMAWTADSFGLAAVAWLSGLQMVGLVVATYLVARRWADPLVAAVVVIGAVLACLPSLSMRPQVLSFIFVMVVTHLWLRAPRGTRLPWITVPLTWLWAMTHGMWPLGIVIGLVAAIAWTMDDHPSKSTVLRRVAVPTAAAAAACLTPLGPKLYGAVILVTSRSEYFAEWQSPDFTAPNCLALGAMLALTVILMMRRPTHTWMAICISVLAASFSVYSLRTVPVAAVMLVPLLSRELQNVVGPASRPSTRELGSVSLMAVLGLAALALIVPKTSASPPEQPGWVDPELAGLPPGTAVLNEWGWGGYLMWRYPNLDLVMHGYGDTFTSAELKRNKDIAGLEPGWDERVEDLDAAYALLYPDSPLAYALTRYEGWRILRYSDDVELLVAP